MASFVLPNPDPGYNVTVSQEEFNLFHSVDRKLFSRLVVGLGRDTTQSTHVMAFFLWAEKKSKDFNLIPNLLEQWPDPMLNSLADEAIIVLNCIESPNFEPYSNSPFNNEKGLPLIQNIMRSNVTLQYFHDNRMEILTAVTKLLNDVCIRAFTDIVEQVQRARAVKEQSYYVANVYGGTIPSLSNPNYVHQVLYYAPAGVAIVPPVPPQQNNLVVVPPIWSNNNNIIINNNEASSSNVIDKYVDYYNREQLSDIFAKLDLDHEGADGVGGVGVGAIGGGGKEKSKEVPVDDRTIFMTFSKGYPITEIEVRDFFTRFFSSPS